MAILKPLSGNPFSISGITKQASSTQLKPTTSKVTPSLSSIPLNTTTSVKTSTPISTIPKIAQAQTGASLTPIKTTITQPPVAKTTQAPTPVNTPTTLPQLTQNTTQTQQVAPQQTLSQPQTPVASKPVFSDLQNKYLQLLNPTSTETDLQQQIDALNAQQANLNASEQLGLNKVEDQPIAMNFIQGQQAALQRQVAAQSGALASQQTPLIQRLAMEQANRQSGLQALQTQIDFENKQTSPITAGNNIVRLNPQTGQYETVYSAPAGAGDGFTLGEGQARYDAKGNLLASQGNSITPYQQAQLDLEQQKLGNGANLTVDQSKSRQFATAAQQAGDILSSLNFQPNVTGVGGLLPNALKSGDRQQFEQASRAFVNAILRRESGATITDDEFKSKQKELIPQPGDSDAVLKQKAAARANAVQNLLQAGLLTGNGSTTNSEFNW